MKKSLIWLLLAVLLLTSCSERPANLTETVETEPETEPYIEPPKTYLEALRENLGYQDFPDSIHCYTEPLIREYSDISAITFDLESKETRFISYNDLYSLEIQWSDGEATLDQPNCNYLTEADGTRIKLCPYEYCRNDITELCSHVNLTNGKIIGDWIYFTGSNECIGAPAHPNREEGILGKVNMLLRYSITENRIEKVMDLPGNASLDIAAYGVMYLSVWNDDLSGWQTVLVDPENQIAAVHSYVSLHDAVPYDGWLYYGCLNRISPDLSEQETVANYNHSLYIEFLGNSKNTFWFLVDCDAADDMKKAPKLYHNTSSVGKRSYLLTYTPRDGFVKVLDHLSHAVLTNDSLYVTKRGNRQSFIVTEDRTTDPDHIAALSLQDVSFPSPEKFFVDTDGTVIRYALTASGKMDPDSGTVFCSEPPGEYLNRITSFGNSIRMHTILYANETENAHRIGSDYYYFERNYLCSPDLRLDGESITSRSGGGWYEE